MQNIHKEKATIQNPKMYHVPQNELVLTNFIQDWIKNIRPNLSSWIQL